VIRQRAVAIFGAIALVIGTLTFVAGAPAAHADPLDPIRGAVNNLRAQSPCGPLNYSIALEGEAQARVGNKLPGVPPAGQYNGQVVRGWYSSDPESKSIAGLMSSSGNAIKDCRYKDFGVGMIRDTEHDFSDVAVALGIPAAPPPPPQPVQCPAGSTTPTVPAGQTCTAAPPVPCPAGSTTPTVPAGQQCTAAPKTKCPDGSSVNAGSDCPAPTDAVSVTFNKGLGVWTVNVANSADISGQCTYKATSDNGTPGSSKNFSIAAKGTANFTVPAPLLLTSYHVVTSCTGNYNGKSVEFGHNEQDVSLGS
jgi:hypothetical protein